MFAFKTRLEIIGINPFVFVPSEILDELFKSSGKDKGAIPICGTVNNKSYIQTLVRYKGDWRLYINTKILPNSPTRIGEEVEVTIQFDPNDRAPKPHPKLTKALKENKEAKKVFDNLSPSKQKEIVRYLSFLKSKESLTKNIEKAIGFLTGKNKFVGRDKP